MIHYPHRARKVADAIERGSVPGIGFNMSAYCTSLNNGLLSNNSPHPCGTVACIAGWTAMLYTAGGMERTTPLSVGALQRLSVSVNMIDYVRDVFGMDQDSALELTAPEGRTWGDISCSHAVAVLRLLADTGEVTWSLRALC